VTWDREEIMDALTESEAMLADGFEDALIGIFRRFGQEPIAAYDYGKCIDILMEEGATYEEATEYFEFNVIGAWVGDGTPGFVVKMEEQCS